MEEILKLRGLSKQFATHSAVNNLSLTINRGAFFSLLGPSGCGKTTTLRLIAGFEAPTAGEIWLNGSRIDSLPPFRRNVNTVFQSYALFPHLTVLGNVQFGLRDAPGPDAARRVSQVLEQVQMSDKQRRKPAELSGGERQRVALARALVMAPEVLLLDEPLSALDPQLRKQVRAELKALQRQTGVTFLFVTHDQEEALALSDRMAVMRGGEIEQAGTPEELYEKPRTRFVASFLGEMNWVDGVGIRPESVRVSVHGGSNARPGRIVQTTFLGAHRHLAVALEGGEAITAQTAAAVSFTPGETVQVSWDPADELLFFFMTRVRSIFVTPAAILMLVTIAVPAAIILVYSFSSRGAYGGVELPWTPENYSRLIDPLYGGILLRSLALATAATVICIGLGFSLALFIAQSGARKDLYLSLVILPFWTSFLIRLYAWMFLLRDTGLINSMLRWLGLIRQPLPLLYNDAAVLLGLVYGFLPFAVLPIYATLERLDRSLLEAAADLGAPPLAVLTRVTLPLSAPGMGAAAILVFVPCMGTYITSDLLGGSKTILIGNLVQNQFTTARDWPFGAAVSILLMIFALLMMFAVRRRGEELL